MHLHIINGPNLNLLGKRETEIYGSATFEEVFEELRSAFPSAEWSWFQSNVEGELINEIQRAGFTMDYILLNAGGYTHTSVSLADAVRAVPAKTIEVHISNIWAREEVRHRSLIGPHCVGSISGFGMHSYRLAAEACILMDGNENL
jgi:3-dehydroquinate dehydratase-2